MSQPQRFNNTLEESICSSVWRDLKQIGIRARYVIVPLGDTTKRKELKNWDLWGPLLLCIVLAVTLSMKSGGSDQGSNDVFGTVFCVVWVGAVFVTINAQLLGGQMYVSVSNS